MAQSVNIKCGNMRKPQEFVIYPNGTHPDGILLQSDTRCASLNKKTGVFVLSKAVKQYPTFHLLHTGVVCEIPDSLKEEIRREYASAGNGRNGVINLTGPNRGF